MNYRRSIAGIALAILLAGVVVPLSSGDGARAAGSGAVISSAACTQTSLPRNDDSSALDIDLPFPINFYGVTYRSLWVNNNGNVTMTGPLSTFTPYGLIDARTAIIAPFFADVDTRSSGSDVVKFGYGTTTYQGRAAFCVNWVNVGYFNSQSNKLNSFQLLLVDRSDKGVGAFDIVFSYDKIQWETGSASGGSSGLGGFSARAGFSSGTAAPGTSTELQGSGVNGAFLDSSSTGLIHGSQGSPVNGRFILEVRANGVVADKYVALGDSYQSGEGTYFYQQGTDEPSRYCHRSLHAYPSQLVIRGAVRLELINRACSGAVIDDLYYSAKETDKIPWANGPAQLDALGPDTKLVTVGIGGNDAEFVGTMQRCVATNVVTFGTVIASPCQRVFHPSVEENMQSMKDGEIREDLDRLYREIQRRAPHAKVIVVSYPKFFPASPPLMSYCHNIKRGDQMWLNDAVRQADTSIGTAAKAAGFSYVNMVDVLAGHELCTSAPGLNGVDWNAPGLEPAKAESFHPNVLGHQMMTDLIIAETGRIIEPQFYLHPGETVSRTTTVAPGSRALHANVGWPGSDVITTLISPSGKRYDRSNPLEAKHGKGETYEYFDVPSLEAGEWIVEMFGADVDPLGEPITYQMMDEQPPNLNPVASFTTAGSGTTYRFDATNSSDADGAVADYSWDFGDGTTSNAPIVEHTFPVGTQYQVMLAVTDNEGAEGFTTDDRIVGTLGRTFGATTSLSDTVAVAGPTFVTGDFTCTASATVTGSLSVSGNVHLTNGCRIDGTVQAGGNILRNSTASSNAGLWSESVPTILGNPLMNSAPTVTGDVIAHGNVRFESTGTITSSIHAGGAFQSIDGKTNDELISGGQVGGTITENEVLADFVPVVPAEVMADPAQWAGYAHTTWTQWMDHTAAANGAVSPTTRALVDQPDCAMESSLLGAGKNVVTITVDTLVDAQDPKCSTVSPEGITVSLAANLTIFATGLKSVTGLRVESADGNRHTLTIIVPGQTGCDSANSMNLLLNPTSDPLVSMNLYAAGKLELGPGTRIIGNASAGCFTPHWDAKITYE